MKQRTDNERLLADVLSAESDSEFSANVLAETLRGVRRRRHVRQVRRYGVALAAVVAATFVSSHFFRGPSSRTAANVSKPSTYQLVVTQPLTSAQLTETQFFSPGHPVSTGSVSLIRTTSGGFGEIGDDELIALAAPNVVALVRRGPHEAELVFVSAPTEDSSSQQN